MIVSIVGDFCYVYREPGDPKFRPNRSEHSWSSPGWYAAESRLLFNVQKILNERGYGLLKKRMWRDGHLFGSDHSQYLRSRNLKSVPSLYVFHANGALEVAAESYNVLGQVRFDVVYGAGREDDANFEMECQEWLRRTEASFPCYEVSWEADCTIDESTASRRLYRGFTNFDEANAFQRLDPERSCRLIDRRANSGSIVVI
jgi:hypothetical protein